MIVPTTPKTVAVVVSPPLPLVAVEPTAKVPVTDSNVTCLIAVSYTHLTLPTILLV